MLSLLQADINRQDYTVLTQHLVGIVLYAYSLQHRAHYMTSQPSVVRRL